MHGEIVVRHCLPTLSGMKTGDLFTMHIKVKLNYR